MGISIGLVGLGAFGSSFVDLFRHHPLVDRVALCDREADRIRKIADRPGWGKKLSPRDCYDSLEAICRSDIEALVVITQPWLHAPQCVQALESGKHVYSAVPVLSVPDGDEILHWCNRLVETCRAAGRHYMLGETTYYHPAAMYCRRRAVAGDFGLFVSADGQYLHDADSPSCSLRDVYRWRTTGQAGEEWKKRIGEYDRRGIIDGPMHYPTHSVSGPLCVMGARAVKVSAIGYRSTMNDPVFGKISNETAVFTLSNGATMTVREYREIGHPGREGFSVYGTQGSFEAGAWFDKKGRTPLTAEQMRDPLPADVAEAWRDPKTGKVDLGGHEGSHAYLANEFVQAVAANRPPAINAWTAVRYMAAGVMAHKSALKDGEVLEVPDWGDGPGVRG